MIADGKAFSDWRDRLLEAVQSYGAAAAEHGAELMGDIGAGTEQRVKRDAAYRRVLDIAFEPTITTPKESA